MSCHFSNNKPINLKFYPHILEDLPYYSTKFQHALNCEINILESNLTICSHLSLFLIRRFLSMPSIRFLNQPAMLVCLLLGWAWISWSRSCSKYFSFNKIRPITKQITHIKSVAQYEAITILPNRGLDMDHWFLQSSNMMMLRTVASICWRISGCILITWTRASFSGTTWPLRSLPGFKKNHYFPECNGFFCEIKALVKQSCIFLKTYFLPKSQHLTNKYLCNNFYLSELFVWKDKWQCDPGWRSNQCKPSCLKWNNEECCKI